MNKEEQKKQEEATEIIEEILSDDRNETLLAPEEENINESENLEIKEGAPSSEEEYKREDSDLGFTRNIAEIALLKASRKFDVVANFLLGNFNENGEYIIPEKIMEELIALKKVIDKKDGNTVYAKCAYKDGTVLEFVISKVFIDKETNLATSTLTLNEKISKVNGYIQNTISTIVGTYIYKNDEFYEENCLKAFHVVEKPEDDSEGALKGPANYIDARYAYLNVVLETSKEDYKAIEENYFNKCVQILNEIPQGTIILSEFNKKRLQLEKYFITNKNKYRALNDLLTSIIEANPNTLLGVPAYNILMGSLNNKYLLSVKEVSKKLNENPVLQAAKDAQINLILAGQVAVQEVINAPKGKVMAGAPKKKAAAKSNSKGGGGGGGKKGGGGGKKGGGGGDKKKKAEEKKKLAPPSKHPTPPVFNAKPAQFDKDTLIKAKFIDINNIDELKKIKDLENPDEKPKPNNGFKKLNGFEM